MATIEFRTDEAGAAAIAAGLLPRYIRDQARDALPLTDEQKRIPA